MAVNKTVISSVPLSKKTKMHLLCPDRVGKALSKVAVPALGGGAGESERERSGVNGRLLGSVQASDILHLFVTLSIYFYKSAYPLNHLLLVNPTRGSLLVPPGSLLATPKI